MSSLTSPTSITAAESMQSWSGTSIPPPLAAVTLNRLREFRQRRDGLSIVRGLGIVTVGGVLLLLGAVWLDAWGGGLEAWTVGDMPRWLGSAMFYGITTLLLVVLCIQPKRRSLNLENEARRIEQLDARLSERLLPAVELSKSNGSHDSAAFRGQLQRQVAELMAATDVRQLLPWKAVHRWFIWAAMSWLLLAGLCLLPGLHLPQRIARILLPTANLGRVSHVRIVIEQPLPLSQVVPRDDLISIVARIDGELKGEVYLETRTDQTSRQLMLRRGTTVDTSATDASATGAIVTGAIVTGRDAGELVSREPSENNSAANLRYEGVLQAAGAWIDYRVTADGATTGWQRLTTQPRPQVVRFHKTLHHPTYALQSPEVSSEVHGDVETFVGGRVELELELNLPVAEAQLRWLSSVSDEVGQAAPLVLNPATGCFATQFSVKRNGAYRIELVSQATGFTNAFSATYQVIAREDLAPRLSWVQPSSQQVVVGREHLLALDVRVEDEYPLAGLTQRLRKNDGSWVDTDLTALVRGADDPPVTGAPQAVRWELDLLKLDCTAGDFFDVQVVGEDRQGLHGESSLLRILVAGTSIDLPESPASRLRQELAGNLQKSATNLSQQHAPLAPLKQALESQVDSMPTHLQVTQVAATTKELALTLRSSNAALIEQVEQALAETQHGVHELELRSIGSLLSKLNAEQSRELERQAELLSAKDPSRTTSEQTRQLLASVEETVRNFEELSCDVRTMVSHDVLARRAEQLSQLATAQREIVESAGVGIQSPEQRSRRQMVLGLQLRQLQTALRGSTSEVRPETAERFKQLADEMNWMLDQSDHLEEVTSPSEFQAKAADLAKSLEAYPLLHRLDGNLPNAHKDALRRTTQRAGHAGQIVDRLLQTYADPAQSETAPATALEQLTARRMLDRTGSQGDRPYASDLGDAKRSITRLLEDTSQPQAERIEEIAKLAEAVETLAAANAVRSTSGLLSTLARGEKWSTESVEARIMHPQAWETYGLQLERAVGQMRETALPREIADQLEEKGKDLSNAEAIHPNDADLNNRRREMRDLQRRLQQQNARQAQQNERRVQQQLHQVDTGLKRNEQQMQQLARELARSQKRLEENVDEQWLREEVRSQQMRLAQLGATEQAQQQLREELSQRVDIAKQRRDEVNLEQPSALESKNPSSELASALSARAAARSRDLASDLQLWSDDQPVSVRATSQQLGEAGEREQEIGSGATEAAKTLSRAARHEQRLKNEWLSDELEALARQADEVHANEIQFAKAKLATAQEDALSNQSQTGQASAEATQESLQASEQAASALAASADAVRRTLASAAQPNASANSQSASHSASQSASQTSSQTSSLAGSQTSSQANSRANSSQGDSRANSSQANQGSQAAGNKHPLSPQQMARLLDELDAQQQASSELGAQDNHAANSATAGSLSDSAASTLTEAAKQLANRLSRTRQPPAAKASAEQGMATQSMLSNMNPQLPVQVRMLDIDRIEGDWGKLRERAAEEVTETRRESLAPHVRRQVEAYFRGLSERSQQETNQP